MAIETILADVGGVLIKNYDISEDVKTRLNLSEEQFRPLWKRLVTEYGSGHISEEEMWATFANQGGAQVQTTENLFGHPFEEHLVIYEHVIDTFRQLGDSGYRLAILSDTNPNHAEVLKRHGVYALFQPHVFLSHQTGRRKPHPHAYIHALEKMGVENPSTVLFIDDREPNLETARQLGLKTVHSLDNEQQIIEALSKAILS